MKNKSVHSCRFVHHAKFHCIMTTLNKLFKVEFERGGTGKEPKNEVVLLIIRKTFYGRHSTVGDLGLLIRCKHHFYCKFAGVCGGGGGVGGGGLFSSFPDPS